MWSSESSQQQEPFAPGPSVPSPFLTQTQAQRALSNAPLVPPSAPLSAPSAPSVPSDSSASSAGVKESGGTTKGARDGAPLSSVFGQYAADAADAADSAAGPGGAAPRLDVKLPPSLSSFGRQIDQYNALPVDESSHQAQLRALNQLDTSAYAWFGANPSRNLNEQPDARHLRRMLEATQSEHTGIVNTIRQGTVDGSRNELPLDTSGFTPQQEDQATKLWGSLAKQQGHLKVSGEDPAFEARTYGNLARLLQGDHGRDLVSYLDQGNAAAPDVRIQPGDRLRNVATNQEAADLKLRRPRRNKLLSLVDRAWTQLPRDKKKYPPLGASGDAVGEYMDTVLHPDSPHHAKGLRIRDRRYLRNTGSGSDLMMPLQHSDPRSVDDDGNEVITPEFVALAHELGHSAKVRGGARASDLGAPQIDPAERNADWSNSAEELINVRGVENPVRAEHGVPERGRYADNIKSRRLNELTGQVNSAILKNPDIGWDDRDALLRLARGGNQLMDDTFYQERKQAITAKLA